MTEAGTRQGKPRRFVVGRPGDVSEGGHIIVSVDGRDMGIYRLDGAFYALPNRCPHLGGPSCKGQIMHEIHAPVPGDVRGNDDRTFIACPWHNWEFDIRTGQSYWNAKLRARPFMVAVERGDAVRAALDTGTAGRVPGPYMAETVPVSVEDNYLVVSLRAAPANAGAEKEAAS
jgi:3-phenylpropionate/trans-cinnamate dioxygenase ferredoxin subunit